MLLLSHLAVTLAAGLIEPSEIEKRAVDQRNAISQYHVVFTTVSRFGLTADVKSECGVRVEVWFDGKRRRVDVSTMPGVPGCITSALPMLGDKTKSTKVAVTRSVYCEQCTPDGRLISYDQPVTGVIIERPARPGYKAPQAIYCDPRGLGHSTATSPDAPLVQGHLLSPHIAYVAFEPNDQYGPGGGWS